MTPIQLYTYQTPNGHKASIMLEETGLRYDVHIVDYEKRQLTWTYGVPEQKGSKPGFLNYPDDAHLLEDGNFLTADIRNHRVLIIDPRTDRIVTQWGTVFGDEVLAAAILDRLLHHSHTLMIQGESYRLKQKRKAGLLGRVTPST